MSATSHSIPQRSSSVFSTVRSKCGSTVLSSTALTALAAATTATTVSDVLDILSEAVKADRVVTGNSIGRATSVDNS